MDRLPAMVKSRAMGGGSGSATPLAGACPQLPGAGLRRAAGPARRDRGPPGATCAPGSSAARQLASATPSIWPVTGWLSSGYGGRRDPFTGNADFHPGLDISSPQGHKVLAPADGVVSSAGSSGNYGNLIVLDHSFGIVTQVRPPVSLRRLSRPARQARQRHRLCRHHRPLHEPPPALRNLDERPADEPASSARAALNRAAARPLARRSARRAGLPAADVGTMLVKAGVRPAFRDIIVGYPEPPRHSLMIVDTLLAKVIGTRTTAS